MKCKFCKENFATEIELRRHVNIEHLDNIHDWELVYGRQTSIYEGDNKVE